MDKTVLLDTSWTLHTVTLPRNAGLLKLIKSNPTEQQQFSSLSQSLDVYLRRIATPRVRDELNDDTEKTGQLQQCQAGLITIPGHGSAQGLSIETLYQRATHKAILIPSNSIPSSNSTSSAILLLLKGPQSHLKHITAFLTYHFKLADGLVSIPLSLPSSLLLRSLSAFLENVSDTWTPNGTSQHNESSLALDTTSLSIDSTDATQVSALQLAVLHQTINNLKLTITISPSAGLPTNPKTSDINGAQPANETADNTDIPANKVTPNLKTIDLDIPSETIATLLDTDPPPNTNFLGLLQQHLEDRTGLKLPLTPTTANSQANADADETVPPLYVSKITTASLALSVEPGRIKLASRPLTNAESAGYDAETIWRAYGRILQDILAEAGLRLDGNG